MHRIAPPSPLPEDALLIAGLGCQAHAHSADVLAVLRRILPATGTLVAVASLDRRCHLPALTETAAALGVPLLPISADTLRAETECTPSAAARLTGIPAVAEAAALAGARLSARPGQSPVLWLAKQRGPGCTVALATVAQSV